MTGRACPRTAVCFVAAMGPAEVTRPALCPRDGAPTREMVFPPQRQGA